MQLDLKILEIKVKLDLYYWKTNYHIICQLVTHIHNKLCPVSTALDSVHITNCHYSMQPDFSLHRCSDTRCCMCMKIGSCVHTTDCKGNIVAVYSNTAVTALHLPSLSLEIN